jgi:predicted RNase H-like HicB family nuclease
MSAPMSKPRSSLPPTSVFWEKGEAGERGADTEGKACTTRENFGRTYLQHNSTKRRFTVIFEKEDEGGSHVFCPTLPGCHTQSETVEEGIVNIREAMQLYVESLVEDGLPIPEEDIFIKPIEITA